MSIRLKFSQAPKAVIDYIKEKELKVTFDYKELEREAHHKAFTAAKIMKLDILSDVQNSLVEAQAKGYSFEKWKKEIKPILVQKGWYGKKTIINPTTGEIKEINIGSHRLRTIFETNSRMAYARGQANNIYQSINEYLRYNSILDSRTRADHSKHHGLVKHRNDEFWVIHFPPNGWGCRCYVTSHTKADLERKGWSVDTNEIKPFSDSDFAHDVRYLSTESLESTYYKKALKYYENFIRTSPKELHTKGSKVVKEAIDHVYTQSKQKEFENFVDEVIKDKTYYKNIIPAGALEYSVYEFLKTKDIEPSTPHIYLSKHSLLHLQREVKKDKGTALAIEEIKALPSALKNPTMILFDTTHDNILYVFDSQTDERENKIVVEVNYKHKKELLNMIVTTGKVDTQTIEEKIKSKIYKKIK